MEEEKNSLSDYIFSGMDDAGLTSNKMEIMKWLYGDDENMDGFAKQTIYIDPDKNPNPKSHSGRRLVLFKKEECRNRTREEKEAAIFYAMRDSMNTTTSDFAELYNPTGLPGFFPAGFKSRLLHCMDEGIETSLGNTDLDHAILMVDWHNGVFSANAIYAVEKRVWNLGKGEAPGFNYDNPAEQNAKTMARFMIAGIMKFHDFFPQFTDRIYISDDPVNLSFEMKTLMATYGDNLSGTVK